MGRFIFLLTTVFGTSLMGSAAGAQSWQYLGTERASVDAQSVSLIVADSGQTLDSLRVRVRGPEVWLMHVHVSFTDGTRYGAPIRQSLRAGDTSRDVTFPGEPREIREVEMIFRNRDHRVRGQTTFQVYGRRSSPARPAPPRPAPAASTQPASRGWAEMSPAASAAGVGQAARLGSDRLVRSVTSPAARQRAIGARPRPWRTLDRQPLSVRRGRGEVRFRPGSASGARVLRFRAEGRDLYLVGLQLGYADGSTRRVMIRRAMREGESSAAITLPAARLPPRSIRLHYRARGHRGASSQGMISMHGQPR